MNFQTCLRTDKSFTVAFGGDGGEGGDVLGELPVVLSELGYLCPPRDEVRSVIISLVQLVLESINLAIEKRKRKEMSTRI